MKNIIISILFLSVINILGAQTYEVGAFVGGSNFIGDVGATNYMRPNSLAFGGVAKWNISKRYSYRASLIYSNIRGDDAKSDITARQKRDLDFKGKLLEASLGMEFNFFDFNLHNFSKPITPYIYGGVSYFIHDNLYFNFTDKQARDFGNHTTFAIPMALGVKAKIAQHFVAALEVGARYTFTDNIDGSNPDKLPDGLDKNDFRFGNINSDDWYVFSGLTLTYTFGRKPCYACF